MSAGKKPHFQAVTKGAADQLLALMRRLYAHGSMPWRQADARRAVRELLAHKRLGGAWFITVSGEVIGYFVLTLAFSLEFGGAFALLDELYVHELWRERGIGRKALRFVEQQARAMGARAVRLEAGYDNERAVTFYERSGLQREKRYLMTKRLR